MLRYSICIVLVISLSALADEIASREKRQSRGFRVAGKDSFFILDGRETVQLTGGTSRPAPIELTAADVVTCDTQRNEVTSTSRVFTPAITDIQECTFVETDSTGTDQIVIVRDADNARRDFRGPGQLYVGSTRVLFLDGGALGSDLSNVIESNREFLPPDIPPLEILFSRMPPDDLVVNLDNSGDEDGVVDSSDNTLVFTGSRCTQLEPTDFFTYRGDEIEIRRGFSLLERIMDTGTLVQINQRIVNGVPCDELIRSDGSVAEAITGPGVLCTGRNALDLNDNLALFSNSASATRQIISEGTRRQIEGRVDMSSGVASLVVGGNITSLAGQTLVTQTGAQNIDLSGAGFIDKFQGDVRVFDTSNRLLRQFECADPAGIALSRFTNHMIAISSQGGPNVPMTAVEPNGLSVIFNPSMCEVFTYPQMNFAVREIVAENLAQAPSVQPGSIQFSVRTEDFGTNFYADNRLIFRPSSSEIIPLGSGERFSYMNNMITFMNNVGSTGSIPGINQLSALTGLNMLDNFSGSTNIIFNGPGTLYADAEGRAFFTANSNVNDLIMNSLARRFGRVSVVGVRNATGAVDITLNMGGESFFNYGTDTTSMTVTGTQGYVYRDQTISRVNAIRVPSGGSVEYNSTLNQVQIIPGDGGAVTTISGVGMGNRFFAAQDPFGPVGPVPTSRNFPGGGVFYTGRNGHMYLPSMVITEAGYTTLETIDGLDTNPNNQGIPSLSFFGNDGDFQIYTNSSRVLLPGMGTLYRSGSQSFFTNNQNFIQNLGGQISNFRPVDVEYTRETGTIVITSGGSSFSFSIGSRRFDRLATGGTITYSGGNITTSAASGNFIGGGIGSLTIFNGIEFITVNASEVIELPGGGILFIDPNTGMAFYSTDTVTVRRVSTTVNSAQSNFIAPSFPAPGGSVTSKLREVTANFGQIVTVYDGANVDLLCDAGNTNPPASFSFGFFDSNNPDANESFVGVMESDNLMIIADGANRRILRLINVTEGTVEYQCSATSAGSTARAISRVNVRPREDPAIVDSFFPGLPGENEVRVSVQGTRRRLMPIPTVTSISDIAIANPSLLTDVVTIGCKAEGRPKARIRWFEQPAGGVRVPVDLTSTERNETVVRQGQSFLSAQLDTTTLCIEFTCEAENGGPVVSGQIEVCPQRFEADPGPSQETRACSAVECGVGVTERSFEYQRTFEGVAQPDVLLFNQLPAGLVKPLLYLCINQTMPVCPAIGYMFTTTEFSDCSAFCGRGVQTREVTCVRTVNGMVDMTVDDMECTSRGQRRPRSSQGCDNGPCPRFGTGEFGPCSQTCRVGMRMRDVFCLEPSVIVTDDGRTQFVFVNETEIEVCRNYSIEAEPAEVEECNANIPCPVRFLPGGYGPCDNFFCQTRNVSCVIFDPSDPSEVWPADDPGACAAQGLSPPTTVRSCNGGVCDFGFWTITQTGGCSAACGVGTQSQTVVCTEDRDPTSDRIEDGFCNAARRPPSSIPCFLRNCPGVCTNEPFMCSLIARRGMCKSEQLAPLTAGCCRSCPLQATPIPPLPSPRP